MLNMVCVAIENTSFLWYLFSVVLDLIVRGLECVQPVTDLDFGDCFGKKKKLCLEAGEIRNVIPYKPEDYNQGDSAWI